MTCFSFRKGSEHEKQHNEPKTKSIHGTQTLAPVLRPVSRRLTKKPANEPKKVTASLTQRIEVLNWHHDNGRNQSATAWHFAPIYPHLRIKQPLISDWVKCEPEWREKWAQASHQSDRTAKRVRQTLHPEVSEMMQLWVSKAMNDGILLTGEVLRQKWNTFADLVGIPEDERLKLSNGWLGRFKDRNGLQQMKRHGEAASSNAETVTEERKQMQDLIREGGYELRDVFNMDESGLFWGYASHISCSFLMF